jgi:hypothetical protein
MTSLGIGAFVAALSLAATSKRGPRTIRIYGGAAGSAFRRRFAAFREVMRFPVFFWR